MSQDQGHSRVADAKEPKNKCSLCHQVGHSKNHCPQNPQPVRHRIPEKAVAPNRDDGSHFQQDSDDVESLPDRRVGTKFKHRTTWSKDHSRLQGHHFPIQRKIQKNADGNYKNIRQYCKVCNGRGIITCQQCKVCLCIPKEGDIKDCWAYFHSNPDLQL